MINEEGALSIVGAKNGIYFADSDQKEYRKQSAEDIDQYLQFLQILEMWYDEINEPFPLPCRTNYRDAWFHYKKLYEQKSYTKIVQEQYALEEHLIRSVKDAIIKYFQIYLVYIEKIYKRILNDENGLSNEQEEEIREIINRNHLVSEVGGKWDIELYNQLEKITLTSRFPDFAKYVYFTALDHSKILIKLQQLMHSIKNYSTKLRINGTNIYRPTEGDEYIRECVEVYQTLITELDSIHMKRCVFVLGN